MARLGWFGFGVGPSGACPSLLGSVVLVLLVVDPVGVLVGGSPCVGPRWCRIVVFCLGMFRFVSMCFNFAFCFVVFWFVPHTVVLLQD